MEDSIGTIAPGKRADLVLLDRDVLTISPEKMRDRKEVWTMVARKVVWREKQTRLLPGSGNGRIWLCWVVVLDRGSSR
jgi:cytosine/adenosine deaminase-related metal-dependent hydrolase